VIADPARSATGFQMLKVMAADHGWDWVEKLLRNDPLIIGNAAQIDQTIVTGERAAGIMPSMNASDMQKSGAPVAVADVELLFIAPYTTSVVADAPNPEGGQLLVDYLFSDEAAAMYAKYGYFSPKAGAKAPHGFQSLDKLKYRYSEAPAQMSRQEYLDKFNAILQAVRK